MIRDPRPPEPLAETDKLHAALELSRADGLDLGEALVLLDRAPGVAAFAGLGGTTMGELCDDSERMHTVVLAVMEEQRLPYVDALAWMLDRHDEAGGLLADREDRDTVTLSAVLEQGGVSIGRIMTLAAEHEQARTLAAPSTGMVKRELTDWGEVRRPLGEDLDALLADDMGAIRDFRKARDAELIADDGVAEPQESQEWRSWRSAWRSAVNQGTDLLATLELREGERQAELARQRQVDQIERKAQESRLDEARKQRTLAADLLDRAKRLDGAA